ncbi:MAG: ComEC/Rec2 family competence protein [Syntrophomonadaceae bacterium]|jgi:competence protein ComEC
MKNMKRLTLTILLMVSFVFCGCWAPENSINVDLIADGGVTLHFIDVGQGDCTLIQLASGENILIDAGDMGKEEIILDYLRSCGVKHIDHLVATHPHNDHIGSMQAIVEELGIGKIYMPKVAHTTQTYENLLLSIKKKGLKITQAKAGVKMDVNAMFDACFVAPNSDNYESLNDYSAVLKLTYKDQAFLFTGDAEPVSRQEILDGGYDIKADVLKVPHHGSSQSALNAEFLDKVAPKLAIISVGTDNRYGHPHREIMQLLQKAKTEVLRTDINGTIVISCDGDKLTIKPSIEVRNQDPVTNQPQEKYIGNKKSQVFHLSNCRNLPEAHNQVYFSQREEAIESGFRPCSNCNP